MITLLRRFQLTGTVKKTDKLINTVSVLVNKRSSLHSRENNLKWKSNFNKSSSSEGSVVSQYCPPPPIEIATNKILQYISEKNPRTYDEWQDAKDYFYTEISILSDVNFSSIVMNALLVKNLFVAAQSYMKYLQSGNLKPNMLTYLQYAALCGRNVEHSDPEEVSEIFKKIQPFIDNTPVLDMKRASYIVQGLCGTDKWRTSFDYLKKIPEGPSNEMKNSIASAAIRNGDENLAWEIVLRWLKDSDSITNYTIKEFLKYALYLHPKNERKADVFLIKFLKYMEQNSTIIDKNEAKLIEEYFKRHSTEWTISYSKVSRRAECCTCKKGLAFLEFSDEEFKILKDSFLEKSLRKKDIFINTTDEEYSKYIGFLERRKPYHVVVDGLNVAYTVQGAKNGRNLSYHLLQVVKSLSKKSLKILVLGREQMIGWPRSIMQRIGQRADLFLTSNISQDDPFTVYAALESGPHTYLLTMDLLRDHMSCLDSPKLIQLFKKWQQSHQIFFTVNDKSQITFTEPLRYSISIQGDMKTGWHIPVEDNIIREPYEELNNWLCIKKI